MDSESLIKHVENYTKIINSIGYDYHAIDISENSAEEIKVLKDLARRNAEQDGLSLIIRTNEGILEFLTKKK